MENSNFIRSLKIAAFILVSFLLVAVIAYCGGRKNRQDIETQTLSKTDTLYLIDTAKHVSITNKFYHTDLHEATGSFVIDTARIIRNYYTKRFYADTLQDSMIRIIIFDSIKQNNLFYRKKQYELLKPYQTRLTTTTTIPVNVSQKGFYVGAFVGFNSMVSTAGFEANYVTPKINYGLGYDIKNNAVMGKLLFRITRK